MGSHKRLIGRIQDLRWALKHAIARLGDGLGSHPQRDLMAALPLPRTRAPIALREQARVAACKAKWMEITGEAVVEVT